MSTTDRPALGSQPITPPQPDLSTMLPPRPGAKPVSQTAQGPKVDRVVYLPDDLFRQVASACAAERITRTQMVLRALEATHSQLADLVAEDMAPQVIKGTLFDTVVTSGRQGQPAKRQMMIQLTPQQSEVIDRLVPECGARNRSHMVEVALTAHLKTD